MGLTSWQGQSKDVENGFCCLYTKQASFRINNKDWSALSWNKVSEKDKMVSYRLNLAYT